LRRCGRAGVRVCRRLPHSTRLLTRAEGSTQVLPLECRHGVMGAHVVAVDRDRDALGAREVLGRGERGAQRIGDDETIGDEAAGRGALGPAATASIDDALYLFHELVRVDDGHEVLGDRNDKVGLAFSYATQDDDPRPDRCADTVGERAQLLHVALADVRGDDLRRADELRLVEQTGRRGLDAAALFRFELVLQTVTLLV